MAQKSSIIIDTPDFTKLNQFLKKNTFSRIVVIVDTNTLEHCLSDLMESSMSLRNTEVIEIEPGEANKSLAICEVIWEQLLELNIDRSSLIINLGGGVICDLGGFIASTFKRGIPFINIPTSLLAMADASVGGKNGIDFMGVKNCIGTITQPNQVFIVPEFLQTLDNRQMKNGLAEILKIALITDANLFKILQSKKGDLIEIIERAIELKSNIVKKDPFDNGIRKSLNFGHTIGHAIESLYLKKKNHLLHGESVAIGMIIETIIAFHKKLVSKKELQVVNSFIRGAYSTPKISKKDLKDIFQFIRTDKKNMGDQIRMSLIHGIGNVSIDIPVDISEIEEAINIYNA